MKRNSENIDLLGKAIDLNMIHQVATTLLSEPDKSIYGPDDLLLTHHSGQLNIVDAFCKWTKTPAHRALKRYCSPGGFDTMKEALLLVDLNQLQEMTEKLIHSQTILPADTVRKLFEKEYDFKMNVLRDVVLPVMKSGGFMSFVPAWAILSNEFVRRPGYWLVGKYYGSMHSRNVGGWYYMATDEIVLVEDSVLFSFHWFETISRRPGLLTDPGRIRGIEIYKKLRKRYSLEHLCNVLLNLIFMHEKGHQKAWKELKENGYLKGINEMRLMEYEGEDMIRLYSTCAFSDSSIGEFIADCSVVEYISKLPPSWQELYSSVYMLHAYMTAFETETYCTHDPLIISCLAGKISLSELQLFKLYALLNYSDRSDIVQKMSRELKRVCTS